PRNRRRQEAARRQRARSRADRSRPPRRRAPGRSRRSPVDRSPYQGLTMEGTRLTVAVPTRDRRESALGALEAIAGQLRETDELLVVDNGSVDGTGAAAAAW